MRIVSLLKKLPIDVGQAERKDDSAGKRIAFSYVKDGIGKTALDIGCRDGNWARRLEEKGYSVTAVDLEPHYAPAIQLNVEEGLPYQNESFDLIWCTELIEHLYKPEFLFQEVERVLKPGGLAIFTTPNSAWWLYPLIRVFGLTPKKVQNPDHKQFFTARAIRQLAHGYAIIGYFPYAILFFRISVLVGILSPTFIIIGRKSVKK